MNNPIISFLLVLLIEAICALVNYLKDRLMQHMSCREEDSYSFQAEQEYA